MKRTIVVVFAALAALWVGAAPVWGHAEQVTSDPAAGSKVAQIPDHVVINLTETPVEDATAVQVADGCGRQLATDVFTEEKTVHVNIDDGGAPGKWRVRYETVSAEDGHASKGKIAFKVQGKKDCSAPATPEPVDEVTPDDDPKLDPQADEEDESGGSFPVLPVAAVTIAVLGVALLARGGG